MTLRDDLIAAKALIDTPEKWTEYYDVHDAIWSVVKAGPDHNARLLRCIDALAEFLPPRFKHPGRYGQHRTTTHADIMALFDRAIEAAERSK